MLRLHTGPSPRAKKSATSRTNEGQDPEKPLTVEIIKTLLRYLVPPSGTEIPSFLLSEQLRRRHHFLSIPPSDLASYLCLNPDHSSQDINHVLSTLRALPGQSQEQLIGRITYYSDGEELTAHVILGEAEERAIQICFSWEVDNETGDWRYLDVKPLPLPKGVVDTLQEAQEARAKARSAGPLATNGAQAVSDDSYWSLYDNVAPISNGRTSVDGRPRFGISPNGSGFSQNSLSPRREEAYWDRYGYGDDDDEEEEGGQPLVAPISNNRPNLNILSPPSNQFIPAQVWTGTSSRFNAEDLSEALAMHLQPDLAPSSDLAQGLSLNLNTPPPAAPSYNSTIDLASPASDRFLEGSSMRANGGVRMNGKSGTMSPSDKAVSEAVRGVFQLWRNLRQAQGKEGMTPVEEKDTFLSLVSQSLLGL